MRIVKLTLVSILLPGGTFGAGAVELVKPFEVMEQLRRADVEFTTCLAPEESGRAEQERAANPNAGKTSNDGFSGRIIPG